MGSYGKSYKKFCAVANSGAASSLDQGQYLNKNILNTSYVSIYCRFYGRIPDLGPLFSK